MSALWPGTPTTVRLDDLDIICAVLECTTADLLIHEPEVAAARRPKPEPQAATGSATVGAAAGSRRTLPPI
ncbi:helix-turn-helix domain-containing protein [Streptomyces sp. NPDC007917]|uniref:helix-turn-helix domain-containing protein n=1 Tax=Streptomyces sp. NPDC007917 TaxID=3364793 RepID=UPI0036E1A14E